jgi:hypothetical protein
MIRHLSFQWQLMELKLKSRLVLYFPRRDIADEWRSLESFKSKYLGTLWVCVMCRLSFFLALRAVRASARALDRKVQVHTVFYVKHRLLCSLLQYATRTHVAVHLHGQCTCMGLY